MVAIPTSKLKAPAVSTMAAPPPPPPQRHPAPPAAPSAAAGRTPGGAAAAAAAATPSRSEGRQGEEGLQAEDLLERLQTYIQDLGGRLEPG